MLRRVALTLAVALAAFTAFAADSDDPYLWLEGIDDARALSWVEQRNAATAARITALPYYAELYASALKVLDAPTRLPEVTLHGGFVYTLWRDAEHPRGVFRRTPLTDFGAPSPRWQTVLDVDELSRREGKPWAFGGATWLEPDESRCLIRLAPGGGDAVELREFDADTLSFVKGGFTLPASKMVVAWAGRDALFAATNFGAGSMTDSGYARIVKLWRRGTELAQAKTVHEGSVASVGVHGRRFESDNIDLITENISYWNSRRWQLVDGEKVPLDIPATATVVDALNGNLILWLKADWTFRGRTYVSGSVVAAAPSALQGKAGDVVTIVRPTADRIVTAVTVAKSAVLVALLENVKGRLERVVYDQGTWRPEPIPFPDNGRVVVAATDQRSGDALVQFESFLTPPALFHLRRDASTVTPLRTEAPAFDGSKFVVSQFWAVSADGTRVPYFVVEPKNARRDGTAPTWMFSYGGFETALTPSYSGSYEHLHGAYGKLWLERGGVFVLANIRGGGEFGPAWHTSAVKENHPKSFEDFEAVARDLAARKITSPSHLGIEGRSNGGLLVASTVLRHPELYGAVVCGSPLLDMKRYHRLLAGASWMAEYGNPDVPEEWAFLSRYSPYQNLRPGMKLPPVFFYTSTRDDRVHPGHARKMAARMMELGYPVEYFEITEGGHHGSVTNEQLASRIARTFAFLWSKLAAND